VLVIAMALLVPTVALAWWARVVARRTGAVRWVAPAVLGAWVVTTAISVAALLMAYRATSSVDASARSQVLNEGVADVGYVVVVLLVVLCVCAGATGLAARTRADASR
jgi:hypothetical protein